jgi:hypothetical protein
MNTRMSRLLFGVCLLLVTAVVAPQARAKAVSFLEMIPEDAPLAIYAPNYGDFETKVDSISEALALMAPKMSDARAMFGLGEGVNLDGAVGMIFLEFDPMGGEEPPMVMLASVSDYNAVVEALGGDPSAAIAEVMMPMGEPGFAKKVGEYLALAPMAELLEGFEPNPATAQLRIAKMPKGVLATAEKSAVSLLIFDMDPILEAMDQAMQMAAMMGGPSMGAQAQEQQQAMKELATQVDVFALGMDSTQLGVSMNFAAAFVDGSELHSAARAMRASAPLLRKAPAGDFLFVVGMDSKVMKVFEPFKELAGNQPSSDMAWAMLDQCSGQETAIYIPPSGFFGGLLTKAVTINYCEDPEKTFKLATDAIIEMDGTEQNGMKITSNLEPNAAEIAGYPAAKYGFNFVFPPEMAQAGQSMMMMFGGPGPRGYMIPTKNAIVQTIGTDNSFAEEVIKSLESDDGDVLANNADIKAIGKMLPKNRVAEGYIGVEGLAKMAAPMAAMFLGMPLEVPDEMPPIGFAMTVGNGEMGGTTFIPMQLMLSIKEMVEDLQQATNDMQDNYDEEEEDDFPF